MFLVWALACGLWPFGAQYEEGADYVDVYMMHTECISYIRKHTFECDILLRLRCVDVLSVLTPLPLPNSFFFGRVFYGSVCVFILGVILQFVRVDDMISRKLNLSL